MKEANRNWIRALLESGQPTLSTRISSSWPTITEAAGSTGHYDYIEFLAEYAPFDQYDLENIPRAAELHRMGSMIKLDYQNRGYLAQRALASGFQAILFTDHRAAGEVEETLRLIRPDCPGHGGRMGYANRRWIGYRPVSPQLDFAEMAAKSVAAFMIEKKEALENIEEICSVPGVDMVQFGPYDYALSCGFNLKDDPERAKEAERRMIAAALKRQVRPRAEITSPDQARYYLDLGVRDFSLGSEIRIMVDFWSGGGEKMRQFLSSPPANR
jgi:2-keto-3-deoxy-L-rhamnonate aldolase RhmA